MSRVSQVLFALFYVASSYSVTQERTSLLVDELRHSSSHAAQTQIGEGCPQLIDGLPMYRQAKPAANVAFLITPGSSFEFVPHSAERSFHPQTHSLKSLSTRESVSSRAPPFEA
jgi:hypothetical protein